MSVLDQVRDVVIAYTRKYDWVGYYAGPGDRDNDGDPDRYDLDDGNGADCSGWDTNVEDEITRHGLHAPGVSWPLMSTAGHAEIAKERGWILANVTNGRGLTDWVSRLQPGDILIHDTYDDAFNSGGKRGHEGAVAYVIPGTTSIVTSESTSRGGVGLYTRDAEFWCMAIHIPLVADVPAVPAHVWHGWEPFGGVLASGPALCTWGTGRLDAFVQGIDGKVCHKFIVGLAISEWESIGAPTGGMTDTPAAVAWGPDRVDVFVRGKDGHLWHRWYDRRWSVWEDLGGSIVGAPAVCSWGPGRIDVFARDINGALIHKWYENKWSGWESLGGVLTNHPSAAAWEKGRIDVMVRGSDLKLWHKFYTPAGGWSPGYEDLGGALGSAPAVCTWGPGRLDAFARGTDGQLWHKWYDGRWRLWESLGGVLMSEPGACSWGNGRIDVAARGRDNQLWWRVFG